MRLCYDPRTFWSVSRRGVSDLTKYRWNRSYCLVPFSPFEKSELTKKRRVSVTAPVFFSREVQPIPHRFLPPSSIYQLSQERSSRIGGGCSRFLSGKHGAFIDFQKKNSFKSRMVTQDRQGV